MADPVGLWEGLYTAIADQFQLIGGQVMTRTAAVPLVGDTVLTVESTHRFPDSGQIAVDGYLLDYTGRTATTFTGLTQKDGSTGVPEAFRALSTVLDASDVSTTFDGLRDSFFLPTASGNELAIIGSILGLPRPLGMTEDTYRSFLQLVGYFAAQTEVACAAVLDLVVGQGLYDLYEDPINDPFWVFVEFERLGPDYQDPTRKTYMAGSEDQATVTTTTVDVDMPPTLCYGIYADSDPFQLGTNYANTVLSGTIANQVLTTSGLFQPSDLNKGVLVQISGVDTWWRIVDVVSANEAEIRWPIRQGAQIEVGAENIVRLDADWFAPWVEGHRFFVGTGPNAGTYVIQEYIDPRRVRLGTALAPDADFDWSLRPIASGAVTIEVPRASVSGSTVTSGQVMPSNVIVNYTTVDSAQAVRSALVDGTSQDGFYLWDRRETAKQALDLVTAAGIQVGMRYREVVVAGLTAPTDVADLWGWWDGSDPAAAQYNGSNQLTGILDKSGASNHMTVPSPAVLPTSYNIDGVTTDLPGPFPVTVPQQHPSTATGLALSLGDFTIMLLVPIGSTRTTTSTLFSLNIAGSPFYGLQIKQGALGADLEATPPSGPVVAQTVGFDNAAVDGHAIYFVRRSGGNVTIDSWYDKDLGSGIQKPTQVVAADTIASPLAVDEVVFGGRGSITYTWQGTAPINQAALWTRSLSDAEILGLAQWAGDLFGFTGIS